MFIHKDDLTEKQRTHMFLLQEMGIKGVVCVDRQADNYSFFVTLSSGEIVDITWSVALFVEAKMCKDKDRRTIRIKNPETAVKDIAELVTGSWENWTVSTIL